MVIQYKNTLQILIKCNYIVIILEYYEHKEHKSYYYQMHHLFVYNTSNQIFHNCILIILAFSRVYTIVLQLLYNLPINLNVAFF